jgi:hypothetical protein
LSSQGAAALHRAAASFLPGRVSSCPAIALRSIVTLQRIAVLSGLLLIAGCDRDGGAAVQRRLQSAVASKAESFDFAADPAFAWDRLFVFGCYSSKPEVEAAMGFHWPEFTRTSIESSDSVVLVVFVKQNSVVDWFEQPRSIELGWLANGKGYAHSEARFSITRDGGKAELKP